MNSAKGAAAPLLAGLNVAVLLWASASIFLAADRGFDFTDEAFYLLNIRSPRDNVGALSAFGHYLGLFGPHVARLRIVGQIGVLCGNAVLAYQMIRLIAAASEHTMEWPERATIVAVTLTTSLCYYQTWLPTPSYNWFVYLGAVLTATGGVLALRTIRSAKSADDGSRWVAPGLLIGLGGALSFIGRPTSALAFGAIVGVWCVVIFPVRAWLRMGAAAIGLFVLFLVCHVLIFEGGWAAYLRRLTFALDLAGALQVGHTLAGAITRVREGGEEVFRLARDKALLLGLLTFAGVLALLVVAAAWRKARDAASVLWPLALALGFICLAAVFFHSNRTPAETWTAGRLGVQMNMFFAAALLVRIILSFSRLGAVAIFDGAPSRAGATYAVISLFCALALSAAFGSTSGLLTGSVMAFGLFAAAAVVAVAALASGATSPARIGLLTLVGAPAVAFLLSAMQTPYRLPTPVAGQSILTTVVPGAAALRVDERTAEWIGGLSKIAAAGSWKGGETLIDLTGGTPGAALTLGAHAPVTPWLVGGYPGSADYVRKALQAADPAVLKQAWVLTAPDGARRVDPEVLNSVGVAFPEGHVMVGSVRTGYRDEVQFLWKPRDRPQ